MAADKAAAGVGVDRRSAVASGTGSDFCDSGGQLSSSYQAGFH